MHLHFSLSGNSKSRPSIKSLPHYTKNKWLNFDEYTITMEETEWEKDDVEEFTRLVEQSEQLREPAKKELETVDVGIREDKKELKIGTLVTSS